MFLRRLGNEAGNGGVFAGWKGYAVPIGAEQGGDFRFVRMICFSLKIRTSFISTAGGGLAED